MHLRYLAALLLAVGLASHAAAYEGGKDMRGLSKSAPVDSLLEVMSEAFREESTQLWLDKMTDLVRMFSLEDPDAKEHIKALATELSELTQTHNKLREVNHKDLLAVHACSQSDMDDFRLCGLEAVRSYLLAVSSFAKCTVDSGSKCFLSILDCEVNSEGLDEEACACKCTGLWTSTYCDRCSIGTESCQHGSRFNAESCECTDCPEPWHGEVCGDCGLTDDDCEHDGTVNDECTCICGSIWSGDRCETCSLDEKRCKVEGKKDGKKEDECACKCLGHWIGPECDGCGLTSCNGRGEIVQEDCICKCSDSRWAGDTCEKCLLTTDDCGGHPVKDCQCQCPGHLTGDHCGECNLTEESCKNGCNLNKMEGQCRCVSKDDGESSQWGGITCETCLITKCENGGKLDEAACKCNECDKHWGGVRCDECKLKCPPHSSILDEPNCKCECLDGWAGEDCTTCERTKEFCAHGEDIDPDTCTCKCESGVWSGDSCNDCVRDPKSCLHGSILNEDTCICSGCQAPWSGDVCDVCVIKEDSNCKHGGKKNGEKCECRCTNGWRGPLCESCALDKCHNGGEFVEAECKCTCKGHFNGLQCDSCDMDKANELCGKHGFTVTEACRCSEDCPSGWSGDLCNECILQSSSCVHGDDANPVDSSKCECKCKPNWGGRFCDECRPANRDCPAKNKFNEETCSCQCLSLTPRRGDTFEINIALILDLTSSMGVWVKSAKSHFTEVISKIQNSLKSHCGDSLKIEVKLGAVGYRDKGDAKVIETSDKFVNAGEIQPILNNFHEQGGGDWPEDVEDAFASAAKLKGWENGDANFALYVADAPCHGRNCGASGTEYSPSVEQGVAALKQKGVIIINAAVNRSIKRMLNYIKTSYDNAPDPTEMSKDLLAQLKVYDVTMNSEMIADKINEIVDKVLIN